MNEAETSIRIQYFLTAKVSAENSSIHLVSQITALE